MNILLAAILFLSLVVNGILIMKAMQEYKFKHLLIFSNKNDRAKKIIEFIEKYLKNNSIIRGQLYITVYARNSLIQIAYILLLVISHLKS